MGRSSERGEARRGAARGVSVEGNKSGFTGLWSGCPRQRESRGGPVLCSTSGLTRSHGERMAGCDGEDVRCINLLMFRLHERERKIRREREGERE